MTLNEAKEAIELIIKYPKTPIGLHTIKALKLLIEAGKAVIKSRREHHSFVPSLLPGETEE